jgi:hypothetical protein
MQAIRKHFLPLDTLEEYTLTRFMFRETNFGGRSSRKLIFADWPFRYSSWTDFRE